MATKKQQRRRAKQRRHEYEEAYLDAEGNEISAEEYERLTGEKVVAAPAKDGQSKPDRPVQRRGGRTVNPPSWSRVLKRAGIFAPIMFVVVMFISPKGTALVSVAAQTLFLMLIFLPFSYVMDTVTYRMWRRRTGQTDGAKRTGS
jgi:hypothetical protein